MNVARGGWLMALALWACDGARAETAAPAAPAPPAAVPATLPAYWAARPDLVTAMRTALTADPGVAAGRVIVGEVAAFADNEGACTFLRVSLTSRGRADAAASRMALHEALAPLVGSIPTAIPLDHVAAWTDGSGMLRVRLANQPDGVLRGDLEACRTGDRQPDLCRNACAAFMPLPPVTAP